MAGFHDKWAKKAGAAPVVGQKDALQSFQEAVAKQIDLLDKYVKNPTEFSDWRSTWFQRNNGKFKVQIGRDKLDAGNGLKYVDLDTAEEVREFLQDVADHARNDETFQKVIIENRIRRSGLLAAAKASGVKKPRAKK